MLKEHNPIFGKSVIESLSEGMYDNPLFLFREYVQNSSDAIDEAEKRSILEKGSGSINVTIDSEKRIISFEDNGIGIEKEAVPSMLANIGDSKKDRKENKGFRGIGRLGGLGYCQIVRFETTSRGEDTETVLEWDAKRLHEILANKDEHMDAGELIKQITSISFKKTDSEKHFFRVSLIKINSNSSELLDVEEVRRYLSMVAPVPFNYAKFRFVKDIENFLKSNDIEPPNEYRLYLNRDEIFKGYESPLKIEDFKSIDIRGVDCQIIVADNKIVGWYWYCLTNFEGVLPKKCWQRCIRLRKSNIQIGEADCLSNHPRRGISLWKEDRGNNYFLGEVHALDRDLIPNSRRDYFNPSNECSRFEKALSLAFKKLHELYHMSSQLRSENKKVQEANEARKIFETKDKDGAFLNNEERENARKLVEEKEEIRKGAMKHIEKIYSKAKSGAIQLVADEFIPQVIETMDDTPSSPFTPPQQPSKGFAEESISKEIMDVLTKVFNVLEAILPPDQFQQTKDAILGQFLKK